MMLASLLAFLRTLFSFTPRPENNPFAEAWRQRRDNDPGVRRSAPTYIVGEGEPLELPYMRVYIEARDVRGRLLRQYVDLAGYSFHQLNFRKSKWREGIVDRFIMAGGDLAERLTAVAEAKAAQAREEIEQNA